MKSFAGPLRVARSEVIPLVPTLAPQLDEQPTIIQDALTDNLLRNNICPDNIPPEDLNKAERHTIAGFFIGEQRRLLVAEQSEAARFTDFKAPRLRDMGVVLLGSAIALKRPRVTMFKVALQTTLNQGAETVRDTFTYGSEPERQLWPITDRRYQLLRDIAIGLTSDEVVPREGRELIWALKSEALGSVFPGYTDFIKYHVHRPETERVQAAHDLSYLLTSLSGLHFAELLAAQSVRLLRVRVNSDNEEGEYRLQYEPGENGRRKVFPRLGNLPNATLKCPAHAAVSSQPEDSRLRDTNLDYFVHAAINAAADYGLLR